MKVDLKRLTAVIVKRILSKCIRKSTQLKIAKIQGAIWKVKNMRNIKLVSLLCQCIIRKKYLDTSVPSILNQTYPDVEVVLVDDGSTDKAVQCAMNMQS